LLRAGKLGSIPVVGLALIAGGSLIAAASGSTFAQDPFTRPLPRPRLRFRGHSAGHT
jgi:hypothetical protein